MARTTRNTSELPICWRKRTGKSKLHSNIAQRSAKAYQEAVQHEQVLKSVLEKEKEDLGGLTTSGVEYARLKQQSEEDKKRYDNLVQRIRDSDIDLGYEKGVARTANPARPSSAAAFPQTRLILPAAFVLASVMGLGLIVIVDSVENRVSSAESAARHHERERDGEVTHHQGQDAAGGTHGGRRQP